VLEPASSFVGEGGADLSPPLPPTIWLVFLDREDIQVGEGGRKATESCDSRIYSSVTITTA
jgi:hypothetical protein